MNIFSVDVEEVEHAFTFGPVKKPRFRAYEDLKPLLELLEQTGTTGTFFLVGQVAEALPELVDALKEDHEVGFHTWHHTRLWDMGPGQLREELGRFKALVGGFIGFRAPRFSLDHRTTWALKELEGAGLKYDSSLVPARALVYGVAGAPTGPFRPRGINIWEFPLLVLEIGRLRVPCGGGAYLRVFPLELLELAIRSLNKRGRPAVIYVHSWEVGEPSYVLRKAPLPRGLRMFFNTGGRTLRKLRVLLSRFRFVSFRDYMEIEGLL